jgi:hypothetical protein
MSFDRYFAWLKYSTYRLLGRPVLATDLSSTFCRQKLEKHVIRYLNFMSYLFNWIYFDGGGATFIKNFKGGAQALKFVNFWVKSR